MLKCKRKKIFNVISNSYKLDSTAYYLLLILVKLKNIHRSPSPDADGRDFESEASKRPMGIYEMGHIR